MFYCHLRSKDGYGNNDRNGNILMIVRMVDLMIPTVETIRRYAVSNNAQIFDALESHWDTAVAFDLYPCVEYDDGKLITIRGPDRGSW